MWLATVPLIRTRKGTREVKVSHAPSALSASFDDSSLVSCAALVPVLELAQRCGLADLVGQRVTVPGANAPVKITGLVAGMIAGAADSIADMDLLRHDAMGRLFTGIRAPSTLGTFLRSFRFGHVRQLDAVAAAVLARLAAAVPLLAAADAVAYIDVDDTLKQTYGYTKQGAGYGYTGVKGINALLGTVSTPTAAPVICVARLRKGSANSVRGAARLVADALLAAARAGADPKGVEEFLAEVLPALQDELYALQNGDAGPRKLLWSHIEPVSLFGAERTARGWDEVEPVFDRTTFAAKDHRHPQRVLL
jgi:hypothetical protein